MLSPGPSVLVRPVGRHFPQPYWSGVADYLLDDRGRRNRRRTRQVHHLTNVVQVVELASPVVAHYQDVGLVLHNIVTFLLKTFLDEHRIDSLDIGNDLEALLLTEDRVATLLGEVELV